MTIYATRASESAAWVFSNALPTDQELEPDQVQEPESPMPGLIAGLLEVGVAAALGVDVPYSRFGGWGHGGGHGFGGGGHVWRRSQLRRRLWSRRRRTASLEQKSAKPQGMKMKRIAIFLFFALGATHAQCGDYTTQQGRCELKMAIAMGVASEDSASNKQTIREMAHGLCDEIFVSPMLPLMLLTFDKQSNIRRAIGLVSRRQRRAFCGAGFV